MLASNISLFSPVTYLSEMIHHFDDHIMFFKTGLKPSTKDCIGKMKMIGIFLLFLDAPHPNRLSKAWIVTVMARPVMGAQNMILKGFFLFFLVIRM